MKTAQKQQPNCYLEPEVLALLHTQAKVEGVSPSDLLRKLLAFHKEANETFDQAQQLLDDVMREYSESLEEVIMPSYIDYDE